jgi:hypothetical protein
MSGQSSGPLFSFFDKVLMGIIDLSLLAIGALFLKYTPRFYRYLDKNDGPHRFQFSLRSALILTPIAAAIVYWRIMVVSKLNYPAWLMFDALSVIAAVIASVFTKTLAQWFLVFGLIVFIIPVLCLLVAALFIIISL